MVTARSAFSIKASEHGLYCHMQKIVLLFVAAVLSVAPAYSQPQRPDHLMPEDSLLSGGPSVVSSRYNELVVYVFSDGYSRDVTLRAVVLPSFSLEYLVGLRDDKIAGGTGYRVFYLRPSIHLWDYEILRLMQTGEMVQGSSNPKDDVAKLQADEIAKLKSRLPANPRDVPLTRCEKPLDATVAQRVSAAWSSILHETRYPPAGPMLRFTDGTTYHFSGYFREEGFRFLAGQTRWPEPDSKPGRLAELADTLVRYCDGKADAAELERQAAELTERLDK